MGDLKAAVAQVKEAYDFVEYVRSAGVTLKQAGPGKWKGLCVAHSERTASMNVDETYGSLHCFGCGFHADLIAFVCHMENLTFIEALRKLAEDKSIVLDLDNRGSDTTVDYRAVRAVLKETANFFVLEYRKLPSDHAARHEVLKRGLTEKNFPYGYAPEGRTTLYKHLKTLGYKDESILAAGVCTQWEDDNGNKKPIQDFWHGRLMFVITDTSGKPIGFSGRKLFEGDTRGKYVNSKDGVLFDKGNALFNLHAAKVEASKEKRMFVVEGQFDVTAFTEASLPNAVASSGTAFTERQANIIRRLVGEDGKIVFAFDGDAAGVKAAEKVFKNIPLIHTQASVVTFPEGMDPSDYRQVNGNEALRSYVEQTVPLVEFVLKETARAFDLKGDVLASAKYLEAAAKILKTITNVALRDHYAKQVALEAFVSLETVRDTMDRVQAEVDTQEESPTPAPLMEDVTALEPEDEEEQQRDTIQRIHREETYGILARLIKLSFAKPELFHRLDDLGKIPPLFEATIQEAQAQGDRFIAENFTYTILVNHIIAEDYFKLWQTFSDEDLLAQFDYLMARLNRARVSKANQMIVRRNQEFLVNGSIEMLEKALAAELAHVSS